MEQLGVFLLPPPPPPLDEMLVHHRVTLSIKFAFPFIYLDGERHCEISLAQEYSTMTMSLGSARAWGAQSRDEHTNNGATMPPNDCV